MNIKEIKIIKSILNKEIGRSWPLFVIKCLINKRYIFNKTRWANKKGAESKFARRLSFSATIFLNLKEKMGKEKAFEIMRELLVSIGCYEQWRHLQSLKILNKKPMTRMMAFNDLMDRKGTPQFNKRVYVKHDDNICHFVITRCVFSDFFIEVGTSELTKLFCEVDKEFFPKAFAEFDFHRGSSWENTIAYGQDHCEFIFKKKKKK